MPLRVTAPLGLRPESAISVAVSAIRRVSAFARKPMMHYTFDAVVRTVTRKLPCSKCGKELSRTFKGECTVNPFNKDENGNPLDRAAVALQSVAAAERDADRAEQEGVTCKDCSEKPYRDALLAFADGEPLPERKWANVTDILLDRKSVEEVRDQSPCPHCGQNQWKLLGHRLTEKGQRIVERLRAASVESPKGQDAQRLDAKHESAVPAGETPTPIHHPPEEKLG